jgi:hypothetical protein
MNPPVYTTDTSPDAFAVQARCFRLLTPAQRLRKACAMSHRGKRLAIEAIRRRHPGLGPDETRLKYIELAYGAALAEDVRRWQRERNA